MQLCRSFDLYARSLPSASILGNENISTFKSYFEKLCNDDSGGSFYPLK